MHAESMHDITGQFWPRCEKEIAHRRSAHHPLSPYLGSDNRQSRAEPDSRCRFGNRTGLAFPNSGSSDEIPAM
jgi:hypothetical protein